MADNLNLSTRVGMNTAPLAKAVGTAKQQLRSLNKDLKQQKAAFKDVGMGSTELANREKMLTQAIKNQSSYLKQKRADYEKVKASIGDMNNMTAKEVSALNKARNAVSKEEYALRGYKNELSRVKSQQVQLNSSTSKLTSEIKQNEINTKRVAAYWRQLGKEGKALKAEYQGLAAQTSKYSAAVSKEEANLKKLKATYSANSNVIKQQEQKIAGLRTQQSKLITSQEKVRMAMEKAGATAKKVSNQYRIMGEKARTAGMNMRSIGHSMSAYVALPATLALGSMVKLGIGFEDSMQKVKSISGATSGEFAQLEAKAREMGATTRFSATESAGAMEKMAMAGWKTKQMTSGISGIMDLAAASGENLVEVSDYVTDGLTAFGMKAKESGRFADVLAASSANANTNVKMMGEGFKYAAPVAGALGYTVEDTALAIGLMSNAGIKSEKAGTALRTMMTNLAKPTKQMKDKMDELGIALTDSKGEMLPFKDVMDNLRERFKGLSKDQQASAAAAIFGKEAMSGALAVINASESDYNKLAGAISNSNGEAKRMADEMNNTVKGRLLTLRSSVEELGLSFYETLKPALKVIISALTSFVRALTKAPGFVKVLVTILGVLAVVIPPVVIGLGMLVTAFGALSGVGAVLGGVMTTISGALAALTSPIWITIGVIAALGAAFVVAYKKSETFRNIVNGALKAIVQGFKIAWEAIKSIGAGIGSFIYNNIIQPIAQFSQGIIQQIQAFWQANGPMITQAIKNIWNVAQPVLTTLFNLFKTVFTGIVTVVGSVLSGLWQVAQPILTAFGQSFMAIWNFIVLSFKNVWNVIKGVVQGSLDVILGIVKIFGGIFTGNWSAVWDGLKQVVSGVVTAVVAIFKGLWTTLVNVIGLFGSILKAAWFGLWGALKGVVTGVLGVIVSFVKMSFNNMIAFLNFIWTAMKTSAQLSWNAIKFVILTPIQSLIQWFRMVLPGLKNLFFLIWNGIKVTTMTIVRTLVNGIKLVFSGLKIFITMVFTAIKNFILLSWRTTKAIVLTVVRLLVSGIKIAFNGLKNAIMLIFNTIKTTSILVWTTIKNKVVALARTLWRLVVAAFNSLKAGVTRIFNAIKSFAILVWTTIKNKVIALARTLKNLVIKTFNVLSSNIRRIFNAIKNFAISVWTNIKNKVVNLARALWHNVVKAFNALKSKTTAIFNSIRSFLVKVWTSIKNKVTGLAKALWNGVRNSWNALSKGTRQIMGSVGSYLKNKWNSIKSSTVGIVTSMKSKVIGVMGKMKGAIKSVTGKISDLFGGMIKGVKKGLNALIKGVNWVGGKLGMDKLPEVKLHTGTEHTNTTRNVVKNGKIARDTFATVGDKGRGNGPGGFRNEMIKYPNGKTAITPNKDTTAFLPKGSSVMSGAQTHSMLNSLPKFSTGTNPLGNGNKKPKKKKKGDNVFGDAWDAAKAGAAKVVSGGKAVATNVGKSVGSAVGKGKKWLENAIGEVEDWIDNPGKLLNKVFEAFGVSLGGFGIPKAAELPYNMMKGMFKKLKDSAVDKVKEWFEESSAGDGGYIDLSKGINFGFARTAAEARAQGYPFARAHHGLDINYKYDKVYSTLSGIATGSSGWNGGFGQNMWIRAKNGLEAIYGHLHKLAFHGKKRVKPGTYLGISGGDPGRDGQNAGSSTGPHLHYEMRRNGVAFDPTNWLKKNNGGGGKAGGSGASNARKAIKRAQAILGGRYKSSYITEQMMRVAKRESNYQAGAVNDWDINAKNGTPSKGMFQMIEPSFRAFAKRGHGNILNPVDEAISAMRYIVAKYGWGGFKRAGDYAYAKGTNSAHRGWAQVHEKGGEIMNLRGGEQIIPHDVSIKALSNLLSSELFNKTQTAVYKGISTYADELRQQEVEKRKQRQNERTNQANNNDIAEMKSMFNDMLYLMQRMVGASEETAQNTNGILNKSDNSSKGKSHEDLSKQLGFDYVMNSYNSGLHV